MNKKGYAAIIGIIVSLIFGFVVYGLIFDAIEPEITGALIKLEGNMICPPELSQGDFNICFSAEGEVIANGNFEKDIQIEVNGQICPIISGKYESVNVCKLEKLWEAEKMYVGGMGILGTTKTVKISTMISYMKSGKYIRLLKFVKYIPK